MAVVAALQRLRRERSSLAHIAVPTVLAIFSFFYFADVYLRASGKYFWYDELMTLSLSRFVHLPQLWTAVTSGVDFNPPPFYLLTHLSASLFGGGLIGLRLPEILGFWIFCLCLFRFVFRRAGLAAGLVALLFPMLSGAYFYAYEARPHALVLGCCGLALVCWQMALERPWTPAWRIAFSTALLAAFLMHCYAIVILVPFAAAEIYRTIASKKVNWAMWSAMLVPAFCASLLYLPLLFSFHKANGHSSFDILFPSSWVQVQHFYLSLLSHCTIILVCAAVLLAADKLLPNASPVESVYPVDVVLGFGFLTIPLFGIALGKIVHGPFFARYFLSALIGVAVLIAVGIGFSKRWMAPALAFAMAALLGTSFLALVVHRLHGQGEFLPEPSTQLILDAVPGQPLSLHSALVRNAGSSTPIGVLNSLEFYYLVHYDPSLRTRLYLVTPTRNSLEYGGALSFRPWSADGYNPPLSYADFVNSNHHLLLYGDEGHLGQIPKVSNAGAQVQWVKAADDHFLVALQSTTH